jgi:replication-associated recombination protein RarA
LDTDIYRLMAIRDSKTKELVGTDGIIYAGPGRGKSTLMNWLYVQLQRDSEYCPFLFILRTEDAVSDLKDFVEHVVSKRLRTAKGHRPLLLVDGYDEVSEDERKVVSAALMEYRATGSGNFFLTCRTFYDVYDLSPVS